jgi:predicted dehydrogenase
MKNTLKRRDFIRTAVGGTIALGLSPKALSINLDHPDMKRAGIIGLDTSHSVAFAETLNSQNAGPEFRGYKITAAYPMGSSTIKSSAERIPEYTEDVKKLGVEIVKSIDELLGKVDVIFLETNDGRLHVEQVIPVLKAGKRVFIDKPVAASLADVIAIYNAAQHYKVPLFSSSSLRYINGAKEIAAGTIGKVMGADTYSPAHLEKTHPDLFWYGIHGVETLFTVMGIGCKQVVRVFTEDTDVVAGKWNDGRIGTFRGMRSGKSDYGGTVFGEKGISVLGTFEGYNPLLMKITEFFETGIPPVSSDETVAIYTFMEAADESKRKGGIPIETEQVLLKAKKKAEKISI